jgi:hypothetical protein
MRYREGTFRRQLELGVILADTKLTPRPQNTGVGLLERFACRVLCVSSLTSKPD